VVRNIKQDFLYYKNLPKAKLITPEALEIVRTEVDPRGVFTTMPTA
jgi:hypothetical protein